MRKRGKLDIPLLVLCGSFLLGGILGVLSAGLLTEEDSLVAYYTEYFALVEQGALENHLGRVTWANFATPLVAFFLGFTFLGVVGVPVVLGIEGFLFGFSVSTLCRILGLTGLIPGFVLFCLPALLWVPVLFVLGGQSFRAGLMQLGRWDWREVYPRGYFFRCLCGFLVTGGVVLVDYFVIPALLQGLLGG